MNLLKKAAAAALVIVLMIPVINGCAKNMGISLLGGSGVGEKQLTRYDAQFLDLFDTVTSIVGYAGDKESFTAFAQEFHDELEQYHQLYDIYNDYEGVNNLKTINDNAGIAPVKVDRRIIDMLLTAREMDRETGERMNVAMGSVLSIWHDYRTAGIGDPSHALLPPMEELKTASRHTDIDKMVIDKENSTVYLEDEKMSLDVGAIAKGYATEKVCEMLEADGFTNALISVGGNVRAIGAKDDKSPWKVGIQNPDMKAGDKYVHSVNLVDRSLVTSGSYQRYYTVEGKTYHHIIDPDTLMPSDRYLSVTVLCRDSGIADAMSTALFNMDLEEGKELVKSMKETEALWILPDGTEAYSEGFRSYMEK